MSGTPPGLYIWPTGGKNFPQTILKAAAGNRRLEVVSDQRGSPTSARDLAAGFGELIARDAAGIVHLTNRGDCSWYEYAVFVVKTAGIRHRHSHGVLPGIGVSVVHGRQPARHR